MRTLLTIIGIAVIAAVVWLLVSPLVIDAETNHSQPLQVSDNRAVRHLSVDGRTEVLDAARETPVSFIEDPMPRLPNRLSPVIVSRGGLQGADAEHQGRGRLKLYRLARGRHVLRFEQLFVTNGPQLHVYLVAHPVPQQAEHVLAKFVDLGPLKGNKGNQNYPLQLGTDLDEYHSVVVWSQLFDLIFASASLR